MPCVEENVLLDLKTSKNCNLRGGVQCAFYNKYDNIDWDAMKDDPALFDQANQCILGYALNADAQPFACLEFERKTSTYSATYTKDAGVYESIFTLNFKGKGKELRNALCDAIQCCRLIIHIFDNNCEERVFGVEWTKTDFVEDIEPFEIIRHLDQGGLLGSTEPGDEIDFGGESLCPPLYGQVGSKDTFTALYT